MTRIEHLTFAHDQHATAAQTAALDLLNEMNAEHRISTAEMIVLLASLVRLDDATAVLTPALLDCFKPYGALARRFSNSETTSCKR